MVTADLFAGVSQPQWRESLAPGAWVLRGFALDFAHSISAALATIEVRNPPRRMRTPGGRSMSAAMTNCGQFGWVTDARGYRYTVQDPEDGQPWAELPPAFLTLAEGAAHAVGYPGFLPDACLINRYGPGSRMGLHQDKNEQDFSAPIVSVSLGVPATFLFGGRQRNERPQSVPLTHGDVVVWGGPARLRYHGVAPLKPGYHAFAGEDRINLTLRKAG